MKKTIAFLEGQLKVSEEKAQQTALHAKHVVSSCSYRKGLLAKAQQDRRLLKAENRKNCKTNACLLSALVLKRKELKCACAREQYCKDKISKLEEKCQKLSAENESLIEKKACLEDECETLKETMGSVIAENDWLYEIVHQDIPDKINTFDGYKYTTDMQQCVYKLLELNVACRNVPAVISTVLSFGGKSASKLPSRSTVINMNIQRLALAQHQLAEELAVKENTTLLSDETTKYDTKLEGIHASDMEGRVWVLGLREIQTKSASDVFMTFQQILSDIDDRSKVTENEVSRKILVNISSRLSDRAATELKFGELIEEARKEILPLVKDGFDSMSEEDQIATSRIVVFSCGLHGLVHFAESASMSICEAEKALCDGEVPCGDPQMAIAGEAGTIRLIRTCCKAFARGADERNGCHLQFTAYVKPFLEENKFMSLPLTPFRGNRFNILFANAGHIFFLKDKMTAYLEGNKSNRLLRSVLCDLKCCEFLAGCKALGLLSKFITTPLWKMLEDNTIHILDMRERYQQLVTCLHEAAADTVSFMEGNILPFGKSTPVNRDCVLDRLLQDNSYDDKVQVILSILLPAIAKLCEKLYADHLPGGKFEHADASTYLKTQSAPKHNKFSESVFALADFLMRTKPSISVLSCEAYIMFSHNRTMEWILNQQPELVESLLSSARREARVLRKVFKSRHNDIIEARRIATEEKLRKANEAKIRRIQELQKFTDDIVRHGLWQTESEVENMVSTYNTTASKTDALKAQLRFRQHVLKQTNEDNTVFAFSRKDGSRRRNLTVKELTNNVKTLVAKARKLPTTDSGHNLLAGNRIRQKFDVEGASGMVESKWFTGRVISQVPGYPEWYNVKFDTEQPIYTYKLQEDVDRGDLQLLTGR